MQDQSCVVLPTLDQWNGAGRTRKLPMLGEVSGTQSGMVGNTAVARLRQHARSGVRLFSKR